MVSLLPKNMPILQVTFKLKNSFTQFVYEQCPKLVLIFKISFDRSCRSCRHVTVTSSPYQLQSQLKENLISIHTTPRKTALPHQTSLI